MSKDENGKKKKDDSAFLISDDAKEVRIEHDPETGQIILNMAGYIHEFLKTALIEAPFELTDANIKRLRPAVATKLMNKMGAGVKVGDAGGHSCA